MPDPDSMNLPEGVTYLGQVHDEFVFEATPDAIAKLHKALASSNHTDGYDPDGYFFGDVHAAHFEKSDEGQRMMKAMDEIEALHRRGCLTVTGRCAHCGSRLNDGECNDCRFDGYAGGA